MAVLCGSCAAKCQLISLYLYYITLYIKSKFLLLFFYLCYNNFVALPTLVAVRRCHNVLHHYFWKSSHGKYNRILYLQRTRLAFHDNLRQLVQLQRQLYNVKTPESGNSLGSCCHNDLHYFRYLYYITLFIKSKVSIIHPLLIIYFLLISAVAGVISYYICKWWDRHIGK